MFTFLSRFRRQTAVLTALALVASVLVAVPASAADDDPKADYPAKFSACVDNAADDAGFTDVLDVSTSASDINCIAYYGITKGKSATTYDPLASVNREEMALFLTRLAEKVGIELVSDPADPGFTDIGDLSAESQTAIAQLKELGITKGNNASGTTYGPSDQVTRGHMALFIARLMDNMTPIGGKDSVWGHTPSDVKDGDYKVGSPFTDLDRVTKETYDAITHLWELGVASGISATGYAPSASIRRDHMAGFMTGVMDHSNLRPAGLSIQASETSGFGEVTAAVVVSVRNADFVPVVDQAVAVFSSEADNGGLNKDGTCSTANDAISGDCDWSENDEPTDDSGNIVDDDAGANEGMTAVYYAWIGDEDTTKFDADDVEYVSVSIESSKAELSMKVTSTVNKHADKGSDEGPKVHLGRTSSVTYTVQLVDAVDGGGDPVAKAGVKVKVKVSKAGDDVSTSTHETNDDGQVSFTVAGPDDDKDDESQSRTDTITITYQQPDPPPESLIVVEAQAEETETIRWIEEPSATFSAQVMAASAFVIKEGDDDAKVSASITFYDQYGAPFRQARGQTAGINFDGTDKQDAENNEVGDSAGTANVRSSGVAVRSATLQGQSAGAPITVNYVTNPEESPDDVPVTTIIDGASDIAADIIQVVVEADADKTGPKNVHTAYTDDNQFTTETSTPENADLLYSYDSGDTFVDGTGTAQGEGAIVDMEAFEKLIAQPETEANAAVVDIIIYNPNGSSIFRVTIKSASS